jgi:hypothetical protein
MKAARSVRGLGACALVLVTGCGGATIPTFAQAAAGAPHAVVEVRTHYLLPPADGRLQHESVFVEGLRVVEPVGRIEGGYVRAVRVPPGAAVWTIDASFGARQKGPTCAREKGPTPRSQFSLAAADA